MITLLYSRIIKRDLHPISMALVVLKKSFLLLVGLASLLIAQGQDKKHLVQADQYFAAGEYLTAAHLYQQYLKPSRNTIPPSDFPLNSKRSSNVKTAYTTTTTVEIKQADSYRLANYWNDAARLYLKCYEKDPVKNDTALYWYAICQRSLGNYSAADEYLNRFINESNNTTYKALAIKEKSVLQFINSQLVRPDTVLFQLQKLVVNAGSNKSVSAPFLTEKNQVLFTSIQTDSNTVTSINPYHNRLFLSTLKENDLQEIEPITINGLDINSNQGAASLSADGQQLYFTQWKKENGKNVSVIYYSSKKGEEWSQPVYIASVNQKGYNSKQPYCTLDGRFLYFASDQEGGYGNFDIWYAPILSEGIIGTPVNAGSTINTPDNEQAPFYHASTETLVFSSDRYIGMGGYDLYSANGSTTLWEHPENMGYPLNSSRDDVYFFTSTEGFLLRNAIISSDRGADCCIESFRVVKADKKKVITGLIRDCETNELIEAAEVKFKDATGKEKNTLTDHAGQYYFELEELSNDWNVRKEAFTEKAGTIAIDRINKSGWLIDTLYNEAICLERKKLVIKVENVVTLYFDFDQSKLKNREMEQMDSIYMVLLESPTATLQISGYTDGRGSAAYNQKLSDKRAKSCADYLIKKGIDANRISFESFGSCCPVEMELINGRDNPDGRSSNRRALINIKKD